MVDGQLLPVGLALHLEVLVVLLVADRGSRAGEHDVDRPLRDAADHRRVIVAGGHIGERRKQVAVLLDQLGLALLQVVLRHLVREPDELDLAIAQLDRTWSCHAEGERHIKGQQR